MDMILNAVKFVFDLGAIAILPLIITIMGLVFKVKFRDALRNGLTVGVGFSGLVLVINLLMSAIQPALTYYKNLGSGFQVVDVGWPAVGAAAWTVPFAGLTIILGMALNIFLVRMKITKTLNVDVWNYMHIIIPGGMVYYLFHSFIAGLIVSLIAAVAVLFIGDLLAPKWQEYFGLEGTTNTTLVFTAWGIPFAWLVNKLVDFVPGLNKVDLNPKRINEKFGAFGSPVIIGFLVGVILGIITKNNVANMLTMGMGVAGVMVLMPKMVGVLMEGITPIASAAQEYMTKSTEGDSEVNIGMDICLGLGDECTIATTVISIPLVIVCALIFPGIQLFPVGLLMSVCYISVGCTMMSKGNLFRSVLTTVLFCTVTMYLAGYVAPGATEFLQGAGVKVDGLATEFTLSEPWNVLIYLLSKLGM